MTLDKYFDIKDIVEAVDIVIGDDGFRSREVKEILVGSFPHVSRKRNGSTIRLKYPRRAI